MTFTEVAFEVGDPRHPLCRLTRPPHDSYAIYRVLDTGQASRRHRANLAFHGPEEAAVELVRDLRAARPEDHVEILFQGPRMTSIGIDGPVEAPHHLGGAGRPAPALAPLLQTAAVDALVEPMVATDGRIRARLVVPRALEPQDALRALQDLQRASGFVDFRVLRVAGTPPGTQVDLARRVLPPEQEELLDLAASMGYYTTPKGVTLEQIAGSVGLSISPVHKRLKAAEESLVQLHVEPTPQEALRRRQRREIARIDPSCLWEVTITVRAPDFGPSAWVAQHPGTRAMLQAVSEERETRQGTSVLVALGSEESLARLAASVQARPEVVQATTLSRAPDHTSVRLSTRERGAYSLSWWTETWGHDAHLRPIVFQGTEATLRIILLRPHTHERFFARLADCARIAGWADHEIVSMRPVRGSRTPPHLPEPLTPRQLEVLRIAHALGYYRTPRGCTLEDVAGTLGVSANAIHKNLVLAESKLIAAYLTAGL